MASGNQQLNFAIRAVNEAQAALKSVSGDIDEIGKSAQQAEQHSGRFSSALGNVASIAGGFVLAQGIIQAPGFLMEAAQAAADDAANVEKLKKAVENTGASWDDYAGSIKAVIEDGQRKAFTDDQIRNSLALMTAQTGSADEAQRRLALAMDLSRGAGIDLETASRLLGKVTEDNVNVLGRYGITVAEGATETELFGAIQARFGGQAETFAKSTAGQMEAAKIGMGELKEQIGTALLPAFTKVGTTIAQQLPKVQAFVGDFSDGLAKKLGPALDQAAELVQRFGGFIRDFVGDIRWAIENGTGFSEQLVPQFAAVSEAIAGVVIWVRDKLIPAFRDFFENDVVPKVQALVEAFRTIAPIASDLGSRMIELAKTIGEALLPKIERLIEFLSEHKEFIVGFGVAIMATMVPAMVAWAASAWANVTAHIALAAATLVAYAPIVALVAGITLLVAGIILLVKNWDDVTARFPIVGKAADELKAQFERFTGWITETFVPAVKNIADTVADAVRAAVAFVTEHWDEIRAVIEPAIEALRVIIQYQWDQIKVIFETAFNIIKGLLDVFIGVFTGDWDRAWQGVQQIAQSIWDGITGLIQNATGAITGILNIFGVDVGAIWGAIRDTIGGIVDGIRDKVVGVFEGMVNTVKNLFNGLIDRVNGVIGAINSALEFTTPSIPIPFGPDIPGIHVDAPDINPVPPLLAKGGIVRARPGGTLALLGEAGRDEAVIPLDRAGASMGATYHFYRPVQIVLPNVRNADEFMRELDRAVI